MLNEKGFDLWADHYDKTVQISEDNNQYPFAGYKQILAYIYNEVMQPHQSTILDIGFGTGVLAAKLYEHNHEIIGLDFSKQMISIAQSKMPDAQLIEWDISKGLPGEVHSKVFDSIISTYALHHLREEEKVSVINDILPLLKENGKIFIGDVAFPTRRQLEACRLENIDVWDEDEFYFVVEELSDRLKGICTCKFHPVSHCGGVIVLEK
ncbi:class I SAM-dependent methyltransferase [Halobacillus sp. B23F22_1]|uniref:class I SAM-dependent methyltransferase n=1 Tax=Halobacillus sp. B23F22_1 TaxID=3459514 RepID=UPI00373E270A